MPGIFGFLRRGNKQEASNEVTDAGTEPMTQGIPPEADEPRPQTEQEAASEGNREEGSDASADGDTAATEGAEAANE